MARLSQEPARLDTDRHFQTLADRFQGKRLNSPNDAVYRSSGDLYFTDPPYGLLKLNDDPAKELGHNGVYRLDRNGELMLQYGGGGHENAGTCQVPNDKADSVLEKLIAKIASDG